MTARLDMVDAPVRPESPIVLEGYLAGGGSVVDGTFANARGLDNLAYDDLTDGVALDDGFVLTDRADSALVRVSRDSSGTLTLTRLIGGNGASTGLGQAGRPSCPIHRGSLATAHRASSSWIGATGGWCGGT